MTAKKYVDGLSYDEFKNIRVVSDNPNFMQFLVGPSDDVVASATLAQQYESVGVPNELTKSAEALHYLVVAVNNRMCGNA